MTKNTSQRSYYSSQCEGLTLLPVILSCRFSIVVNQCWLTVADDDDDDDDDDDGDEPGAIIGDGDRKRAPFLVWGWRHDMGQFCYF